MKAISPLISALVFVLAKEAATVIATPNQGSDVGNEARQATASGPVTFCNLSSQCITFNVSLGFGTPECIDFTGSLAFLNNQLKTMSSNKVGCLPFADLGCTGTSFSVDPPGHGTYTIDYTNYKGQDVSGVISSVRCPAFVLS